MLKRRRDGRFELRLPAEERTFLASLADQMDELLDEAPDDPSLRRLSPPAYLDDIVREAEYQVFMADDLRKSRRASLEVLRETARRTELSEEEVVRWMQAINAIRLVLGTRLGIDSDDLGKVFFVFRRGKNTAAQNVAGKGVGLASVKSIVETYDGTIWVESELGKGSTFRFTINGKYVPDTQKHATAIVPPPPQGRAA